MIASYHDVMARKATTVRIPEELAATAELVARGRGTSVNGLILEALEAEIQRVRREKDFMARLKGIVDQNRAVLDRLAET